MSPDLGLSLRPRNAFETGEVLEGGANQNGASDMTIGANYPVPVYVNGYACNNCAQVAEAKQDINPADPQAGPGGIDAKSASNSSQAPAFTLGGLLANSATSSGASPPQPASGAPSTGQPPQGAVSPQPTGYGGLLNISA